MKFPLPSKGYFFMKSPLLSKGYFNVELCVTTSLLCKW